MMDRRNFLGLAAMAPAGFLLDPEQLLWVPGAKKIFDLGEYQGPLLTIEMIAKEALKILERRLAFGGVRRMRTAPIYGIGEGDTIRHVQIVSPRDGMNRKEFDASVEPAMALMAEAIRHDNPKAGFGELDLPHGADEAAAAKGKSNVSLRAVRQFNIGWDHFDLRFDVLYR